MYPRQDQPRPVPSAPPPLHAAEHISTDYSTPISAASAATMSSHNLLPIPHNHPQHAQHPQQQPQHIQPQHPQHIQHPAHAQHPGHMQLHHAQQQQHAHPLTPWSGTKDGRVYKLEVVQQPVRARMCGFGDKDRRPITPPPCIKLIVLDAATGKECDHNDVDSTYFVLTVDLWNSDGTQEVNLVRHSSNSPAVSISTATTTAYPPPPERPYLGIMNPSQLSMYLGQPMPGQQPGYASANAPIQPAYYSTNPGTPVTQQSYPGYAAPAQQPAAYMPVAIAPTTTQGMFTRNLIGSLSVNAFRLTDTENKVGFWFVLQDLSVRTEGHFRLKMNFVDVGAGDGTNSLNTGKAPVLATCYSEVFQVYSAKKFPGVIESTPLSKVFAQQGIKIPIRKDGPKQLSNQAEYDQD